MKKKPTFHPHGQRCVSPELTVARQNGGSGKEAESEFELRSYPCLSQCEY